MSMYVIYPADELIQLIVAHEYSVPSKRSLPSPIVPHQPEPEHTQQPDQSCDPDRKQLQRGPSLKYDYEYSKPSATSIVFPVSLLLSTPPPASAPPRPPPRQSQSQSPSSSSFEPLGPPPPLPPRSKLASSSVTRKLKVSFPFSVQEQEERNRLPSKAGGEGDDRENERDSTSWNHVGIGGDEDKRRRSNSKSSSASSGAQQESSTAKTKTNTTTFSFNRILNWKTKAGLLRHDKIKPTSSCSIAEAPYAYAFGVTPEPHQTVNTTPTFGQLDAGVKKKEKSHHDVNLLSPAVTVTVTAAVNHNPATALSPAPAPQGRTKPKPAPALRRFTFQVIHEEKEEEDVKDKLPVPVSAELKVDDFLNFRNLHKRQDKVVKPELRRSLSESVTRASTKAKSSPMLKDVMSTSILNVLGTGSGGAGGAAGGGATGGGVTGLPSGGIIGSLSSASSSSGVGLGIAGLPVGAGAGLLGPGGASGGGSASDSTSLRDMVHPSLNEALKAHNSLSFKLIRIVSDFTQQLSQIHEQHSVELQHLVENFRKRNGEIRKERPPCSSSLFQVWETLLQEVEIDSQTHSDISGSLGRQVARQLLEKTFCRKIQSRKIFAHRESFETVLNKSEGLLSNAYRDYCDACEAHLRQGTSASLAQYYEAHNAYVHQLRGTNAMLKEYQTETLPALLQELEEIYVDICAAVADSVLNGTEIITSRGHEGCRRYENLVAVCRNINGVQDLRDYAKCVAGLPPNNQPTKYAFTLPAALLPGADGNGSLGAGAGVDPAVPILKDEVIQDRLTLVSLRARHDGLKKEMGELESDMRQLQDALDTLLRMQTRSLESNLFNKANELQEEISMKKFDVRVGQMRLSAMKAQRELYTTKSDVGGAAGGGAFGASSSQLMNNVGGGGGPGGADGSSSGYMSSSSSFIRDRKTPPPPSTMKSKWLKAFRSLKSSPPQPSTPLKEIKKNGKEKDIKDGSFQIFENHIFQEYTYKKITPCDICSQILRGHTKQGMRCRMCKTNVHFDCQAKVGKCQPKTRLLRRQKSTSELETRLSQLGLNDPDGQLTAQLQEMTAQQQRGGEDQPDIIYQVLKQATDMNKKPSGAGGSVSSGSGSGNGFHGSSQTIYSQGQDPYGGAYASSSNPGPSTQHRRSNPTVNVIGNSGTSHSGTSTPALAAAQAAAFHPSSSGRRDSYASGKSLSADADGSPGAGDGGALSMSPPPRAISLPSTQTPHSPRRRKLDLRMKSFSLDSPESTEHAQRRRYNKEPGSQPQSHSTSHSQSPSSPVHNRRGLLTARNVRMSSVELPDENDKSLSSASTSPCPSPQKPHRLLPTNLYVVLYMFKARHPDELDLKAGYKVTVTDTTDPDWWQGKCLGRIGYFPSKYVTKLHPGEKPLQVTHNLQVTDGAENGLKLLRDQIVIQIGEELDGMVTIRNGENKQGVCPLRYLQEV